MDKQTYAVLKKKIDNVTENIDEVVDGWLEENIAQETGYVLDSTLSMSNAAAPADKVGDLKTAINDARIAFPVSAWENKGIAASTGEKQTNAKRLTLKNRIGLDSRNDVTLFTTGDYSFSVVVYQGRTYVGYMKTGGGTTKTAADCWKGTSFTISMATYGSYQFDIVLYRSDNANMSASESTCLLYYINGTLGTIEDTTQNASYNFIGTKNAIIASDIKANGRRDYASSELWEIGAISILPEGWFYPEGYDARIRLKKGNFLFLKKGDVVKLTDYSNARFYIGYRYNNQYYYSANWKTSDYVVTTDGEYNICVARLNDSTPISSLSDLLNLLVIERPYGIKNVKDYGALGDGTTNDATAIQNALNTGGTIFFPAGTYAVGNQLIFYSDTHIIMDDGATILRNAEKNGVFYSHCSNSTLEYNGVHDVIFEGGTIDLGTSITQGGLGIGVIHGSNIIIRNVTFKHFNKGYHACDICCSKDITVENCIFSDILSDSEYAECIQIDSADQFTSFPSPELTSGAETFDSTPTINVEIYGCKFYLNSYSPAIGNHNDIASKGIMFHDNFIIGNGGSRGAVAFDHYAEYYPNPNATTEIMIHHNIFEGCTYGFKFDVDGTGKAYIRDNIFKDIGTLKINPTSDVGEFTNNIGADSDDPFIVTLTPTAQDYSGTMDKTVAEIKSAYDAGKRIVFRVMESATSYSDVAVTMTYQGAFLQYPSFNAFIVMDQLNLLVFAFTGTTNDGTSATYGTTIYPLTPMS